MNPETEGNGPTPQNTDPGDNLTPLPFSSGEGAEAIPENSHALEIAPGRGHPPKLARPAKHFSTDERIERPASSQGIETTTLEGQAVPETSSRRCPLRNPYLSPWQTRLSSRDSHPSMANVQALEPGSTEWKSSGKPSQNIE